MLRVTLNLLFVGCLSIATLAAPSARVTAAWDVVAYAKNHRAYPCEPTLQQLYDGSEFEAYRELGAQAVDVATSDGKLPNAPGQPRTPGQPVRLAEQSDLSLVGTRP